LIGLYNANNINAAITIGKHFKVDDAAIKQAIEGYIPENNRSQLLTKGTNEIILDAYNANPSSMAVAIENFVQLDKANKMMILGDMFELGPESWGEHHSIVNLLAEKAHGTVYLIGKDFYANRTDRSGFSFFETFDQMAQAIKAHPPKNTMMLIKGSRGMALERVLELL
jgi:UDP-N-acetylmuramoyl-tripeptide--D-alanyl-D-alanine ligase